MSLRKIMNVFKLKSYLYLKGAFGMQRKMLEVIMRGVFGVLVVILLLPAISFAEGGGNTYLEIKGGQYKPLGDLRERRAPNSSNIEVSIGHRFFKYFAAEVSYGHFRIEADTETAVLVHPVYGNFFFKSHDTIDVYPLLVSGKILWPVDDGFFYVGGGYGRYQVVYVGEFQVDSSLGHDEDNFRGTDTVNGWHYMLGTMYDINDSWTIGLEYKQVTTETAELEDAVFIGTEAELSGTYKTDVDGRMISAFIQMRF